MPDESEPTQTNATRGELTVLVMAEVPKAMRGSVFQSKPLRSAPHYFETSVPHQVLVGDEERRVLGRPVTFLLKGYPPDIFLVTAKVPAPDIFGTAVFELEEALTAACFEIVKARGGSRKFSETYSVFTVAGYAGEPERFLDAHGATIAALLKSERVELDRKEVEYTLATNIKYAKHDLAIVDWDGAFLFDIEGDFDQTIELLTLANVQLLRHRIMDHQLDERLAAIAELVKAPLALNRALRSADLSDELRWILKERAAAITQFQTLERDIKLIGDWYLARLYDLAARKFKLHEWRASLREKLEAIERIYATVIENFSVSEKERTERRQMIAEWVLIVGWFVLIVLELYFYLTR